LLSKWIDGTVGKQSEDGLARDQISGLWGGGVPQYLIEAPHTEQNCIRTLKYIAAYSTHILSRSWFGCMDDVHVGWVAVEADSKPEALNVIPPPERPDACVTEVRRFTQAELEAFHESA
jgi:hypothetical protein